VLDPYRLVISFTALIHTVCYLKIYLHETMKTVIFLRMFQDKYNRDCNCEHLQCNRNRNRLHCDFVYS